MNYYMQPHHHVTCPYYMQPHVCHTCIMHHHGQMMPMAHNHGMEVGKFRDHGKEPYVVNINQAAQRNKYFRTALWTGNQLQVTLMSIAPGESVGLEVHPDTDQFLRIEAGQGLVQMGPTKDSLPFTYQAKDDDAIMVPAGTWHNLTNTGNQALKLYSIYAPPEHPFGTIHETKADDV